VGNYAALGDQGIAIPGEQDLPVADGFVAAAAQGIVAHGDGLCIWAFDGAAIAELP
jgi:hypothetical protein